MTILNERDIISLTRQSDFNVLSATYSYTFTPTDDLTTTEIDESTAQATVIYSALDQAELTGISLIKSFLAHRYDVDAGLTLRDPLLLRYLTDITLFEAYTTAQPHDIADVRAKRYDDARKDLMSIGKGSLSTEIPLLVVDDYRPGERIIVGSSSPTKRANLDMM